MKSIVSFIVMAFLLLQVSWSAASPYCQHETGSGGRHFGHHAHQHLPGPGDQPDGAGKAGADRDCSACQGSLPTLMCAELPMPVHALHMARSTRHALIFHSRPPDTPFRPAWPALR